MNEQEPTVDDRRLAAEIKAQAPADDDVPPFHAVFTNAERQFRDSQRSQRRLLGSAAALALIAIGSVIMFDAGAPSAVPTYVHADELLSTTQWRAPSDILLPTHEIDLYQELPVFLESTKPLEGALL
ncbi:MAG: hypothetical protein HKN77_02295 [Woeseiaceae bacterium]|nr:hypothetical protein [Woeseiaceae bacterium]